jgi:DNA-binding NtrC family response regulator
MNDKFEGLVQHFVLGNFYLEEAVEMLERSMIKLVIESTEGNQSEASKRLGIHRNTLKKKLVVYGLGGRSRKTAGHQDRPRKPKAGVA